MKNILITGAGAVLGQGIIRSILQSKEKLYNIHTVDPNILSTGHFLADAAHTIPLVNDERYLDVLISILKNNSIDLILIGTDSELPFYAKYKNFLEKEFNLIVLVSNEKSIQIANDKWATSKFLKSSNFPYPLSAMANNLEEVENLLSKSNYPFFAKPIDGARSRGLLKINNHIQLQDVLKTPKNLVIQEYLEDDEGEYTSGCLVFDGKCKSVVTLRRDLRDGNTYRAFYKNDYSKFDDYIAKVAEKLNIFGPCNFQFRIKDNKPVIFEINARFSGTTPIRFMFGFNEVLASLDFLLFNKDIKKPNLLQGTVLRAWSDIFIETDVLNEFSRDNTIINPKSTFYTFEK